MLQPFGQQSAEHERSQMVHHKRTLQAVFVEFALGRSDAYVVDQHLQVRITFEQRGRQLARLRNRTHIADGQFKVFTLCVAANSIKCGLPFVRRG